MRNITNKQFIEKLRSEALYKHKKYTGVTELLNEAADRLENTEKELISKAHIENMVKLTYCPKCNISSDFNYCPKCGGRKPNDAKAKYIIPHNERTALKMKYRTKPCEIEAYQTDKEMIIHTLEGDMKASVGDYIITGLNGEQYPCKPDIFEKKYERADNLTNYDRIRNMSIEEMAEFIEAVQIDALFLEETIHDLKYPVEWKQYLESEVSENANSCNCKKR